MSKSINNQQFMEWVDQYVNDTITPEAAKRLLECVQENPERLDELCSQLQTDRLLEIVNKQNQMNSIAEAVLERTKGMASSKDRKNIRRSKSILKVAASVAIVAGIGYLAGIPALSGRTDQAKEAQQRAKRDKPKVRVMKSSAPMADAKSDLGHDGRVSQRPDDELVALEAESPKPLFAGTQINSPTLEISSQWDNPDFVAKAKKKAGQAGDVSVLESIPAQQVHIEAKFVEYNEEALGELGFSVDNFGAKPHETDYAMTKYETRTINGGTFTQNPNRENYATIEENEFKNTADKALSTFSIDVDTASYSNIRRFLNQGALPPADAVRIEEMINYFNYDYPGPEGHPPFSTSMALTDCPWNENHQLLRIGLQGKKLNDDEQKNSNLVFLLDVSGSMDSPDKLPLLKRGFEKMVRALGKKDRVAIVVYAGSSGVVLDSTSAMNKETIINAMNRLNAGGSTAGGQGIELAYKLASDHFIKDGINRVILATDGDFNVGTSSEDALQKLIEAKRNTGVFLSVLGFGTGNLQDAKMELLANKGNGNYFYIDSEREAEKVLVKQLMANMVTIAKDVKIQVEFNPALIRSYRLIGYENRVLAARDFNDDTKDAGEIGAGHQVTALYELIPIGAPATEDGVPLKYTQPDKHSTNDENRSELLTLKLRYKEPDEATSKLLTFALNKNAYRANSMDASFRWSTAIAAFGMHLRGSDQISTFPMSEVLNLARSASERDPDGYRSECIELMEKAMKLKVGEPSPNRYPQWQYRN